MKVAVCACQFYNRIGQEKIAAIHAACQAAGVACEIVPDLCYSFAKDHAALERLADCHAVLACQQRAVRAFFGGAFGERALPACDSGRAISPKPPQCVDLRATPLAEVLAALSLTAVDNPTMPEYEKLSAAWTPWFPVIDTARCVNCKKCADFCMFGVYAVKDGNVVVAQPEACKTDCPACARICPQNAIIFPKSAEEHCNGALAELVKPDPADAAAFRERLRHRRIPRLFKEDEP